ncbi:MAG TPA: M15 family metallopeptidase [Nocardioidaceae bacterium]|nr:M15 family metallopeptidase [Nocardioidaceae bacterium]
MTVRRTRPVSARARGAALAAVPLLLAPLAGCAGESADGLESASTEAVAPLGATPGSPAPGDDASNDVPDVAEVLGQLGPLAMTLPTETETPKPPTKPKVLEGGGFASAVPGSDAPGRKDDVGPQYQVSDDLDIEEIERLVKAVEKIAREQRVGEPLATGGSVAAAVGTFSYRWFADGTVQPDPAWVAANIRTEEVPILGSVTGHKVLFPQLRGALSEVVARGLADEIHPEEFGGCYVPRFIGRDPGNGLSLHTWGIAVDLNVPGNLRGVPGEINRDVVAIFKRWGFAWGGDWAWTDPMHFELAQIVRER